MSTDRFDDVDPAVAAALSAWADESATPARPEAVEAWRAAMHHAVVSATTDLPGRWRRLGGLLTGMPRWVLRYRRLALAGPLAGASAAIVVSGWNAPAGSWLHDVRLAREHLSVTLARGSTHAAELRLGYAEDRIREARDGSGDRAAGLREAGSLLNTVSVDLPRGSEAALWARLGDDENILDSQGVEAAPGVAPSRGSSSGEGEGRPGGSGSTTTSPGTPGGRGGSEDGSSRRSATPPRDSGEGTTTTTTSTTSVSESGDGRSAASPSPDHIGDGSEGTRGRSD